MRRVRRRGAIGSAVICVGLAGAGAVFAQVSPPASQGSGSATAADPIRCWWKSGKSAVYVGERFLVTLTCSVVDTAAVRAVADQSRLDPAALQLSPFDVVGGTRHPDIEAGAQRLFQYQYSLRIIAEDLFGREVTVPALDIRYRVQRAIEGTAVEGPEQVYRLPALPLRVTSLASPLAADIRDMPADTFGGIESRRLRGNVAFTMAALLFSAAMGCLVVAAGGVVRRYRTPPTPAARLLSDHRVLRSALRELERLQHEVQQDGWSRDMAGRALASVRLGMAIAMGQRPPQTAVDEEIRSREGALIIRSGLIRPRWLMVSASVTAEALPPPAHGASPGLEQGTSKEPADPAQRATLTLLDDFRSVLAVFTEARYSQHEHISGAELDRALADALALLQRVRAQRSWWSQTSNAIAREIRRRRAWTR